MIRYVGIIPDRLEHCTICGGQAWKYVAIEVYNYKEYTSHRMCAPNKNMYVCKECARKLSRKLLDYIDKE